MGSDTHDPTWVRNEGVISSRASDLLDVIVWVRRLANNDDVVDIREVDPNHEDVCGNDYSTPIWTPHELPCLMIVLWPVQGVIHPELLTSDAGMRVELPTEVGVYTETIPYARTEYDRLLLSHVINNPSEMWKLPAFDTVAEHTEEELDLWPSVGSPHGVVILESDELADTIGLVTGKQHCRHRDCDHV